MENHLRLFHIYCKGFTIRCLSRWSKPRAKDGKPIGMNRHDSHYLFNKQCLLNKLTIIFRLFGAISKIARL